MTERRRRLLREIVQSQIGRNPWEARRTTTEATLIHEANCRRAEYRRKRNDRRMLGRGACGCGSRAPHELAFIRGSCRDGFFQTAGRNLTGTKTAAGVRHHVALDRRSRRDARQC
jgi:hypothetical protein